MQGLMLSCQKATELVEKKQLVGLSLVERIKLLVHLRLCGSCMNYRKQSLFLQDWWKRQAAQPTEEDTTENPSSNFKKEIIRNLNDR